MLIALMASLALATQQPVTWQIRHGSVDESSHPALEITTHVAARSLEIDVNCAGIQRSRKGPTDQGQTIRLEFPLSPGTHRCQGRLNGEFADGAEGQAPLDFELKMPVKLSLTYSKEALDLDEHWIAVRSSHPLQKLQVEIFGPGGVPLGRGEALADVGSLGPHRVQWDPSPGEVVQIRLRAHGTMGEVYSLDLWPWSYKVPHADLSFATGSHEITTEEGPKLQAALDNIQEVLAKYGQGVGGFPVPIRLYVAGYTDTVGSKSSNQQLSTRRARSIAAWFRRHGFERPIYVQGFGETGLIRPTADEVDDAANRRALYLLSAWHPGQSLLIPADHWKLLD